jgi:anti-sigma factor RsiW
MDCRNFKDVLDSYLCGELAVETNHDCLRHAEQCPPCRAELSARRNLRLTLRTAVTRTCMSEDAQARLRECLRAEAEAELLVQARPNRPPHTTQPRAWAKVWPSTWPSVRLNWLAPNFAIPALVTAVFLLGLGLWGLYAYKHSMEPSSLFAQLSETVMAEAAGDHQMCALQFANAKTPGTTPGWMKEKYPAYAGLAEAAATGAQGMQLKSVHVCSFKARKFGHLVYGQNDKVVSLLVTPRDAACLRNGKIPTDDGVTAGLQHALSTAFQVNAYQTAKYVVLVVSDLPEKENEQLAHRLAGPVSAHLRQIEKSAAHVTEFEINDFVNEMQYYARAIKQE